MTLFKFESIYLLPTDDHDVFQLSGAIIGACRDVPCILGDPIIDASWPMSVQVYFKGEPSEAADAINKAILSAIPDGSSRVAWRVSGHPETRTRAAPAADNILFVRCRP